MIVQSGRWADNCGSRAAGWLPRKRGCDGDNGYCNDGDGSIVVSHSFDNGDCDVGDGDDGDVDGGDGECGDGNGNGGDGGDYKLGVATAEVIWKICIVLQLVMTYSNT